jgi:hypothetical protein
MSGAAQYQPPVDAPSAVSYFTNYSDLLRTLAPLLRAPQTTTLALHRGPASRRVRVASLRFRSPDNTVFFVSHV